MDAKPRLGDKPARFMETGELCDALIEAAWEAKGYLDDEALTPRGEQVFRVLGKMTAAIDELKARLT